MVSPEFANGIISSDYLIGKLVYELYGLSTDEINIVENLPKVIEALGNRVDDMESGRSKIHTDSR